MKRIKKIGIALVGILLMFILTYNIYNFVSLKFLHKDLATVNGYAPLEVVSGSMEPTIKKGDIIIINTKDNDYKIGDIITFYDPKDKTSFITHRIISVEDGKMRTQGDNNKSEDQSLLTEKDIIGKYVFKIKNGGIVLKSFQSPFTMIMIFVIGILVCILMSTDQDGQPILDEEEKEYQEFLKAKQEKDKKTSSTNKKGDDTKKKKQTLPKKKTTGKKTSSNKKVTKNK